jgi:hypothetical protein
MGFLGKFKFRFTQFYEVGQGFIEESSPLATVVALVNVRDVIERRESEERLRFQSGLWDAVGQAITRHRHGGKGRLLDSGRGAYLRVVIRGGKGYRRCVSRSYSPTNSRTPHRR